MAKNTITAARNLAVALNKLSSLTFTASGKFDLITVTVTGFGEPILHKFKTRKDQCEFLEARIDDHIN